MKVIIVEEVITCDVSLVAIFNFNIGNTVMCVVHDDDVCLDAGIIVRSSCLFLFSGQYILVTKRLMFIHGF